MRIYIKTYGCQMNERDSEAAAALLDSNGHAIVASENDADLIILNTCSVRDQAERKAIGKLGILKRLKRENPSLLLGIIGCMAQSRGRELLSSIPHLDFAIGTDMLHTLPETVISLQIGLSKIARTEIDSTGASLQGMDAHRQTAQGSPVSAFISIMRGCDRFCSYCIVPYVRGRERSRGAKDIVKEAKTLVKEGFKEIMLLGQNVAAFGLDGATPPIDDSISPFAELLESLSDIKGLERIRFTSPHPAFFNSRLIDATAALPKVCKAIHLPLQSGSDKVLSLMNRPYTASQYMGIVEALKRLVPDITFSTDIIVGFPGETEKDFEATRRLMEQVPFDNAFIFKYSPRKGTKASGMDDDVPQEVKERRNLTLLDDLAKRVELRNKLLVGRTFEILVEGPSKRNASRWSGRSSTGKLVVFEPVQQVSPGDIIAVRIERSSPSTLFASISL